MTVKEFEAAVEMLTGKSIEEVRNADLDAERVARERRLGPGRWTTWSPLTGRGGNVLRESAQERQEVEGEVDRLVLSNRYYPLLIWMRWLPLFIFAWHRRQTPEQIRRVRGHYEGTFPEALREPPPRDQASPAAKSATERLEFVEPDRQEAYTESKRAESLLTKGSSSA